MKKAFVPFFFLSTLTVVGCTRPVSETVVVPKEAPTVEVESIVAPTPVNPAPATGAQTPATPAVTPQTFTRAQVVTYKSPAGDKDPVEFSLTVTDGIITAASVAPKSDNEVSRKFQTAFAAEVSAKVVGKKAKDLDIDVIGGASLTTAAFEMFAHSF